MILCGQESLTRMVCGGTSQRCSMRRLWVPAPGERMGTKVTLLPEAKLFIIKIPGAGRFTEAHGGGPTMLGGGQVSHPSAQSSPNSPNPHLIPHGPRLTLIDPHLTLRTLAWRRRRAHPQRWSTAGRSSSQRSSSQAHNQSAVACDVGQVARNLLRT